MKTDQQTIKNKFFDNTKLLREITNTSTRTISENTRVSYKKLKQYEIDKLLPDIEILRTYADYFSVPTDFLLGLYDLNDFSQIKPFVPHPNYFCANVLAIEFDEYLQPHNSFSDVLKSLREEIDLTNNRLSKLLNIPLNVIAKYENSKIYDSKPTAQHLTLLSDFFDVTIDYLLGRVEEPNAMLFNGEFTPEVGVAEFSKIDTTHSLFSEEYSDEEKQIIEEYRKLPETSKALFRRMAGITDIVNKK